MKPTLILIALIRGTQLYSQDMTISNGSSQKTIPPGSYVEMWVKNPILLGTDNCGNVSFKGILKSASRDSFAVQLEHYTNRLSCDHLKIEHILQTPRPNIMHKESNDDIYNIVYYKSKKHKKRNEIFQGIGYSAMLVGIATASSGLTWAKGESRDNLLIAGGTEFGLGLILGLIFTKKQHLFYNKGNQTAWQVVHP